MSNRRVAIAVSILFIAQILTAAIGNSLVQAFVDGDSSRNALTGGVLLMMFSGLAIAAIGVVIYQVLKPINHWLAIWVPVIRGIECVVAIIFGIYLLTQLQVVPNHLLWVYILAGTAGVILTYLLLISKLVPRPIAIIGLIGYSLLLLGVPLDFAGVIDMNKGMGQALFIPGGLFEVIVLPMWLFIHGFNVTRQNVYDEVGSAHRFEGAGHDR
ncbi:MAG: DUF4386 family protein [Propionicimonas sp.]